MARSAREIRVKNGELSNDNVSVQIGATENREAPRTIYISMGFWTKPIVDIQNARDVLENAIDDCYKNVESVQLDSIPEFPSKDHNIFIVNMPNNFNYNEKRNYVNVELYLHTLNTKKNNKVPLVGKKDNVLYNSALRVAEAFVSSDLMTEKKGFEIRRSNK